MANSPASRPRRPAGAAPDAARLERQALSHLARYAATEAGLVRVLGRAVDRWARRALEEGQPAETVAGQSAAARAAAAALAARLAAAGAVDDAAFAASRARRLVRSGRSRRAVAAHLSAKGVPGEIARAALPEDEETELAAALAYARRRRIGPFRRAAPEPAAEAATRGRELGMLARAGFPHAVARRALAMPPEAAEAMVAALRRR